MADTQLTQTGTQVQADLDKVEGLANIKTIGSGLSLSTNGELSTSGGGITISGYDVELTLMEMSDPYSISVLGELNGVFGWHKFEKAAYPEGGYETLHNCLMLVCEDGYVRDVEGTYIDMNTGATATFAKSKLLAIIGNVRLIFED